MKWLACLLLTGCAGTDLSPDEFSVNAGVGDADIGGKVGWRNMGADVDSQWIGVGLTWHIGDVAQREHEERYLDALYGIRNAALDGPVATAIPIEPEGPVVVAPTEEHKPKPEEPKSVLLVILPYVPALALGVVGVLNRMGKIDVLTHK